MQDLIGGEDDFISKQTDFKQAVTSTHSKPSRLMSSIHVERCASGCITRTPWDDQVQGWVAVGSLSYTYTSFLGWKNPCWCAFCTLKEMTAIRICCLSHLSQLCMSLGFTHFSFVSLNDCPWLTSSLYLLPSSFNGLSLCFTLGEGCPDKLHVVMLSNDDLPMNLGAINTCHFHTPPASPPGVHTQAFPFPFHSQQS